MLYYVFHAFYALAAGKAAVHEVLIFVFYSFTDAKTALHEDIDGVSFLFSVTAMMKPAAQTCAKAHRGAVTHCRRQRTPSTLGIDRGPAAEMAP